MIQLNNVSLLSYSLDHKYLGDNAYHYSTEKKISVKGYLYDFNSTSGIGNNIITGIAALDLASKSAADQIIINNYNFGTGYITNFSVEKGNWVRLSNYTADIFILDSGNLYNVFSSGNSGYFIKPTGSQYSESGWQILLTEKMQYVDNFSASTSVKKNHQDKSYEIIDTINIKLDPAFVFSGANYARNVRDLFYRSYDDIKRDVKKFDNFEYGIIQYNTEQINEINKQYNFERRFLGTAGDPTGIYFNGANLKHYELSCSVQKDGSVSITEKSRKPKTKDLTLHDVGLWFRSEGLLETEDLENHVSFYLPENVKVSSYYMANKVLIETDDYYEKEYTYGSQEGDINYSVKKSSRFNLSSDTRYPTANISVSIEGFGEPGSPDKWGKASTGFLNNYNDSFRGGKELQDYMDKLDLKFCAEGNTPTPYRDSYSVTASMYNGTASITTTWDTKPIKTGENGKYVEFTTIKEEQPTTEYKNYTIFGENGGTLAQVPYPQKSLGSRNITVTRKYNVPTRFNEVEPPSDPELESQDFIINKKIRISNDTSELEILQHFH